MRLLEDNFGQTKSCYRTVSNCLDPSLVYDYLLSITNEYFVKLTYIPLEDLCQNV